MIQYVVPVRIDMTNYQLTRRVVVYAASEHKACRLACLYVFKCYSKRKGFSGCVCLYNCVHSEQCVTHFLD